MTTWWHAAADLVLGARCPGCGGPGPGTCRACARLTPVDLTDADRDGLAIRAGARYGDHLREVMLAWKVGGRAGHDALMAHLLSSAVLDLLGCRGEVALVPVPATRLARRERGRDLVGDLARRAAAELRGVGVDAQARRVLRLVRQPGEQHELGRQERRRNLHGTMRHARFSSPSRKPVVLVDDIVTTGSTLLEARRALVVAGAGEVIGAATVAAAVGGPESRR